LSELSNFVIFLDCNITIGVSFIDNYVGYIQQTILETNNRSDDR